MKSIEQRAREGITAEWIDDQHTAWLADPTEASFPAWLAERIAALSQAQPVEPGIDSDPPPVVVPGWAWVALESFVTVAADFRRAAEPYVAAIDEGGDAGEDALSDVYDGIANNAAKAITAATDFRPAAQQGEAVAWQRPGANLKFSSWTVHRREVEGYQPLYITPPAQQPSVPDRDWAKLCVNVRDHLRFRETGVSRVPSIGELREWADAFAMLASAPQPSVPEGWVLVPAERLQHASDLLAERAFGSPARSPGHNARLVIDAMLDGPQPQEVGRGN